MRLEDGTDDEERDAHAQCGDEERRFTTETVDREENKERGCEHLDDAVDSRGKEGIRRSGIPDLHSRR